MARPPPGAGHVSTAKTVAVLCLLAALSSTVRAQAVTDIEVATTDTTVPPEQQPQQQQVGVQQDVQQLTEGAVVSAAATHRNDFATSLGNLFKVEETNQQNEAYAILDRTNAYRREHEALPLAWNPTLASSAAKWAARCTFEADPSNKVGENVFATSAGDDVSDTVIAAVNTWYQQGNLYDFKRPEFQISTGAFTQMIWRTTTDMGCAINLCENGLKGEAALGAAIIVICRYSPIGNLDGLFEVNVMPHKEPNARHSPAKTRAFKPLGSHNAKPQLRQQPAAVHQQRQQASQKLQGRPGVVRKANHPQKQVATVAPPPASPPSPPRHQAGAQAQAAKCSATGSQESPFGQNIYTSADDDVVAALYKAPQDWYSGVGTYNYSTPGFDESTKYFSQLVWRGTTSMGCAVQDCAQGISGAAKERALVICRYSPPGNQGTASQYISNVKPGFIVKPLQPATPADDSSSAASMNHPAGPATAAAPPTDSITSNANLQEQTHDTQQTIALTTAAEEVPDDLIPAPATAYEALEAAYPTIAGLLPASMQHLLPAAAGSGARLRLNPNPAQTLTAATALPAGNPAAAMPLTAQVLPASGVPTTNPAAAMPTVIQMLPAPTAAAAAATGQVAPAVYVLVRLPAATAAAAGLTSDYVLDTLLPAVGSAGMVPPVVNGWSGR